VNALAILLFGVLSTVALAQSTPPTRNWFVVLQKGPTPRGTDEDVKRMQQAHLSNFDRLYEEGKLFMAGPLRDPTGIKRGIIGVQAADRQTLLSYFSADPYVQSGMMVIDAQEWKVDRAKVNDNVPDPDKMAEMRFVLMKAQRPIPPSILKQHEAFVDKNLKPALHGQILRNSAFEEVMFFLSNDSAAVDHQLSLDPLVRHGYVAVELMPLWMADGVLK
jgi:uncharacterized protein YciI